MVSLKRFQTLADSYGADLGRWPAEFRTAAQALAAASPQARAMLDEARALDDAIGRAGRHEAARLGDGAEQEAALARLRASVAARLAAPAARRRTGLAWPVLPELGGALLCRLGLATSGGLAIAAGLVIGSMDPAPPAHGDVLAQLEPAPIAVLAGQ